MYYTFTHKLSNLLSLYFNFICLVIYFICIVKNGLLEFEIKKLKSWKKYQLDSIKKSSLKYDDWSHSYG